MDRNAMKGDGSVRKYVVLAALAAVVVLAGCSGGSSGDLEGRLAKLEAENQALKQKVETLTQELRPLEKRVHELDQQNQHLEKAIVQARDDLVSRLREMVQQERSGRTRRFVRPPARVPVKPKPYMGFDGQTLTPEVAEQLKVKATSGVVVTAVRDGGPAKAAGLQKDDVVQKLDGADLKTKEGLIAALGKKAPGQQITLMALRGGKPLELKVTLGRR